jgi:dihydrodipicolinate synthase/N-acetylneuraminate lyase
MTLRLRGSITALVTPFRNGAVDEEALRGHVSWQIENGTHGIVPVGTTGESPTLDHNEHDRGRGDLRRRSEGRVPVIAGAGSNSTAEAIGFARHAEKVGADALLVVTPYYNKPTQEGLYQHFRAINDAVGIPIIIYNIPGRSVIDMTVDTMARLYELKNIAGVKDATANVARTSLQRQAMGPTSSSSRARMRRPSASWPMGPRLHLSDLERRPKAVQRDAGGLSRGRLRRGAEDPRPADAAAHGALHRDEPVAREIRALGAWADVG